MKKILWLLIGLVSGFLIAEFLRREKMQRLATLEAQAAATTERYAEYNREWQRELANMPFDERMDWELFEASLKLDGYIKDDDDEKSD